MIIYQQIFLAILGAALALLVKILLTRPLEYLALRIPWFRAKRGSLNGIWITQYQYASHGDISKMRVKQEIYLLRELPFSLVLGRQIGSENHASGIRSRRDGRSYLTGTYENPENDDELHGVFQLWIYGRGGIMKGHFLGFSASKPNYINQGKWDWIRISTNTNRDAQQKILTESADTIWEREKKRFVEAGLA
jgi:hypothetical protein